MPRQCAHRSRWCAQPVAVVRQCTGDRCEPAEPAANRRRTHRRRGGAGAGCRHRDGRLRRRRAPGRAPRRRAGRHARVRRLAARLRRLVLGRHPGARAELGPDGRRGGAAAGRELAPRAGMGSVERAAATGRPQSRRPAADRSGRPPARAGLPALRRSAGRASGLRAGAGPGPGAVPARPAGRCRALAGRLARPGQPDGQAGAGQLRHLRVLPAAGRLAAGRLRGVRQRDHRGRRPGGVGRVRVRRAFGGSRRDGGRRARRDLRGRPDRPRAAGFRRGLIGRPRCVSRCLSRGLS